MFSLYPNPLIRYGLFDTKSTNIDGHIMVHFTDRFIYCKLFEAILPQKNQLKKI